MNTLEPVMTDVDTEIVWACFGNPLHASGPFREAFGKFRHRWKCRHVDARDVGLSDKNQIAEWAQDHAEDSYFFMTRVRGEFPTVSALQLIPTDIVETAMTREIVFNPREPMVLGVDVARYGDNLSVIYARRGLDARSIPPMTFAKMSTDKLVDKILHFCSEQRVEAIFVDGGGIGAGVVDLLRRHNLPVEDVQFGSKALHSKDIKYANMRAYMWGEMGEALKRLAIPPSSELRDQLISPQYDYNLKGELQLEKKTDMVKRGLQSPDVADALALTYARPVFPRHDMDWANNRAGRCITDYNPLSNESIWGDADGNPIQPLEPRYYAPGWSPLRKEFE